MTKSSPSKAPRPVLRFTVKPFRERKEHIVVRVWATKADMISWSTLNDGCANRTTGAYCHSYDRWKIAPKGKGKDVLMGDFAEVNFHLKQITCETVTHELFHATLAMAYRMGFMKKLIDEKGTSPMVSDAEEDAAYAHGRMCRLVTNRLHRAKVWH